MDHGFHIKHLRLVLASLHAFAAVCGVLVFALSAASIAESNKAVAAANDNVARAVRAFGDYPVGNWNRKLLYTPLYDGYWVIGVAPFLGFTMFVSISGFLLSGFLAACHLKPCVFDKTLGALSAKSPAWAQSPFYELVLATVWSIFWLAAAGVATESPFIRVAGWYCSGTSCAMMNVVVAFSWLSWFTWLAVVVLLAVEYGMDARKARTAAAASNKPSAGREESAGKHAAAADEKDMNAAAASGVVDAADSAAAAAK